MARRFGLPLLGAVLLAETGGPAGARERRMLMGPEVPGEVLQRALPSEPAFASLAELERGCRSTGFQSSPPGAGEPDFMVMEEIRSIATGFYESGAPVLNMDTLLMSVLQQQQRISTVCPTAVLQANLLRAEMLLLEIYTNSADSSGQHAVLFSEASRLNYEYSILHQWLEALLGSEATRGWPLAQGFRRVQRYYDLLWQDVYDSRDAWAIMEEPGLITDDLYHSAMDEVAEVFGSMALEWWPCRGTLIAFLRHGSRSGPLSRGLVDVVERDIDVMIGVADEDEWEYVGKNIELELKALGWSRCWTKASAELGSRLQFVVRKDILYCVRLEPVYMMLDITSYITGTSEPYVFVHRVCGPAAEKPDDGRQTRVLAAGPGCAVAGDIGPLRYGGGVLGKGSIHPLARCRARSIAVPCPRQPLETIRAMAHSGLDPGCIALPDPRGREPSDPWTKRLSDEGLRAEDVEILKQRSAQLDQLGFKSMTPFFGNCSTLEFLPAL